MYIFVVLVSYTFLPAVLGAISSCSSEVATEQECIIRTECAWCLAHDIRQIHISNNVSFCIPYRNFTVLPPHKFSCQGVKTELQPQNLVSPNTPLRTDWEYEINNCIRLSLSDLKKASRKHSAIEAKQHFLDILHKTEHLRKCPHHSYHGYFGPRIENHWINYFLSKLELSNYNLEEYFPGGVIPLFIQWVDCGHKKMTSEINHTLATLIRPDYLYVTVSQGAEGLYLWKHYNAYPENVFVFSAGGHGHTPIPLLNGEKMSVLAECGGFNQTKCHYFTSFTGSFTTGNFRKKYETVMRSFKISPASPYSKVLVARSSPEWEGIMESSVVAMAPRGFGRTSFRLYEAIQKGVLPLHIFDDFEWLPYLGSGKEVHKFGYSVNINELVPVLQKLALDLKPSSVTERRNLMKSLRMSHYSYVGVINQISLYLKFGPSISDLRCNLPPITPRR